jgi:uncharacterized membrane protein
MSVLPALAIHRAVLGYLVAALFGLFATVHVVLPTSFTQPAFLATLILVIAAVTTIVRVRRDGAPEADAKAWWQSKTIWTSVVGALFSILSLFGVSPTFDAGSVVAAVLTVFGLVNAYLYPTVAQPIARSA